MSEVSGEQSLPVHLAHIVLSAERQGKRSPRGDFVPGAPLVKENDAVSGAPMHTACLQQPQNTPGFMEEAEN